MSSTGKRRDFERGFVLALYAAALAGGCMAIAPLEDFPGPAPAPQAGSGGKGGSSGKGGRGGSGGGSGLGGAAGDGTGNDGGAGSSGEAGSGAVGGGTTGPCTTNAECVQRNADEAYRCRPSDHRCVALKSIECPIVDGDFEDPNALYFGAFATLNAAQPAASPIVWSHELALNELSGDNIGGLPDGPGGARRPLVMITCNNDTSVDAAIIDNGMRHLAEEVQVPALLATLKPGDLRRAFDDHRDRKVFFLSPVAATRTLVMEDDDDLIWNLLGQPSDFAPAYAELLGMMEKYATDVRGVTDPLKVALVSTSDAFNDELKNYVQPALTFNDGKTVAENSDDGNYLGITLNLDQDPTQAISDAVTRILDFLPDVVISTAGEPFTAENGVIDGLELSWGELTKQRPMYMLSPFNAGSVSHLQALIQSEMKVVGGNQATDATAYRRFVGVSAASAADQSLQVGYAGRLLDAHPEARDLPVSITDTGNYYDATYYLAYAMYASGSGGEPTGPEIALGMRRLLGGEVFGIEPNQIPDVFQALEVPNQSIELDGTLGPPDFDVETGVRFAIGSVFCFQNNGGLLTVRPDVLRYDLASGNFTGTFPCFPDFAP